MTTSPEKTLEEVAEAVKLHKIHHEKFFSELDISSSSDQLCNGIDNQADPKYKEVKELCSKLVGLLEKLSKAKDSERNNYCSYIRYWLYEQIYEINEDKSASIDNVPFFDNLNHAWTNINNVKLSSKCNPENIKDVKLDELKNRIFSYIYFKNIEKIKKISASENGTDCDKYLTYLKSFKSVHDGYKNNHCRGVFAFTQNGPDYFPCKDKDVLMSRILN
ncbi:hypothetical protein PVNG_02025 [Plasmodium vivax North Korean]|uniref:Uncharacterized protein n=1 Tax=Plasmodium vivax North Korean TaxID=1035514 RepID=A0A0J9TMM9_PLAVI|nr:hypothetical protein PVNG_02025 [Plasmodium vivax North Korean]